MNTLPGVELLQTLQWRQPWWLLLALQPALMAWIRYRLARQKSRHYADDRLAAWAFSPHRYPLKASTLDALYALSWLLFALAMSGPRLPDNAQAGEAGIAPVDATVVLLVDRSRSMQAADIKPSRQRRASVEISEFLDLAPGYRISLKVFAAQPHTYVPPTYDRHALRQYLQTLESLPLPTAGSRLQAAIAQTRAELSKHDSPAAIVVLSDGDSREEAKMGGKANAAGGDIPVFILGIGSEEGAGIPLPNGGWLHHQGQTVVSRMNSRLLRDIAEQTGGFFIPVSADQSDWQTLLNKGLRPHFGHAATDEAGEPRWKNLSSWALAPAFFIWLFLIAPLPGKRLKAHWAAAALFASLLLNAPAPAQAGSLGAPLLETAYAAFAQQNYQDAAALYAEIPGYQGRLGEGAAWYRQQQWGRAVTAWREAVLQAQTPQQRATALYNLGNAWFQQGNYSAAAIAFGDVRRYAPHHEASLQNQRLSLALVQAIVEQAQGRKGRKQRQAAAKLEGLWRGSQLAKQGTVLRDTGIIPDDEGQAPEDDTRALASLPALGDAELAAFLDARTAGQSSPATAALSAQGQIDLTQARIRMENLDDQQAALWQRLFEMEEGFPSPLKQRKTVEGIPPW